MASYYGARFQVVGRSCEWAANRGGDRILDESIDDY
jgi:hypothetical protein